MFQIQNLIECERAIRGTETQFDPKLIVALEAVQDRIEQECYRGEIDQNLISSQDSTPDPAELSAKASLSPIVPCVWAKSYGFYPGPLRRSRCFWRNSCRTLGLGICFANTPDAIRTVSGSFLGYACGTTLM
jgi:hypothetical protein